MKKTSEITRMNREEFDNKFEGEKVKGDMEVSENTKHRLYAIDDKWMYKIDIEPVNLNLMNTEEHGSTYPPLQKRVMMNLTKEACGQDGGSKFQNYSEWN